MILPYHCLKSVSALEIHLRSLAWRPNTLQCMANSNCPVSSLISLLAIINSMCTAHQTVCWTCWGNKITQNRQNKTNKQKNSTTTNHKNVLREVVRSRNTPAAEKPIPMISAAYSLKTSDCQVFTQGACKPHRWYLLTIVQASVGEK